MDEEVLDEEIYTEWIGLVDQEFIYDYYATDNEATMMHAFFDGACDYVLLKRMFLLKRNDVANIAMRLRCMIARHGLVETKEKRCTCFTNIYRYMCI